MAKAEVSASWQPREKRGSAITYGLFSGLPEGAKHKILERYGSQKGFPIANHEYFDPRAEDILLAMREEEMLGGALFVKPTERRREAQVLVVFTRPGHRRLRVGTKLYMRMQFLAKKLGLPVTGHLFSDAQRMHERMAARPKGILKQRRRLR